MADSVHHVIIPLSNICYSEDTRPNETGFDCSNPE